TPLQPAATPRCWPAMPATGPNGSAVTPPWPKSKIGVSRRSGDPRMAHIIVFGNEKGGSGKTTAAIHVAVALARDGRRVGTLDFDLLARIDPATFQIKGPSVYSDFVWDCRKRRLMARRPALDWIVMRNRISSTEARNKKRLAAAIEALAQRIGFRVASGFGDRVIFRELFPMGLTMLDLPQPGLSISLSMSHLAARQEVRGLVHALKLPER